MAKPRKYRVYSKIETFYHKLSFIHSLSEQRQFRSGSKLSLSERTFRLLEKYLW